MLYFHLVFGNLRNICFVIDHSTIQPMLDWIPFKLLNDKISYYHTDEKPETITFRLIWLVMHEMIQFVGLIQLIYSFFFLMDMLMTWIHPIKYISN